MEKIKKIIKDFINIFGIKDTDITIKKDSSLKNRELLKVDIIIPPEEAKYFLKENGTGLNAFQHLLRILISKQIPDYNFFIIDINSYKKDREKFLTELVIGNGAIFLSSF